MAGPCKVGRDCLVRMTPPPQLVPIPFIGRMVESIAPETYLKSQLYAHCNLAAKFSNSDF